MTIRNQFRLLAFLTLAATALPAADARDRVGAAAKQLAAKSGYSWTTMTREADGRGGPLGPIDGKFEQNGLTFLSFVVGGLPIEVYMRGTNGTAKGLEGWQTFDDVARTGATPAAVIRYLRGYQTPAHESAALVSKAKDLKEVDGALTGELPEETVKEFLLIGQRRREGAEPQVANSKGSVKFWLQEGALTKYEINIQGKVTAGDREAVINRTLKTEVKDVGNTKLDMPAEAKQKMS